MNALFTHQVILTYEGRESLTYKGLSMEEAEELIRRAAIDDGVPLEMSVVVEI